MSRSDGAPARAVRRVPARERLPAAAARLSSADGLAATGIDTITAEPFLVPGLQVGADQAELPAGDPARAVVRAHKEEAERLLGGHLDELLAGRRRQARALAEHLAFLLEGAMARAGLEGSGVRLDAL